MTTHSGASVPRQGLVRNAFHLGIGQVITTAATMLLSAAVARALGASEFGVLYLLASVAGFAYVFVDWGHGPYVTREIARHPARSGELMGSVLVVRVGTAVMMAGFTVMVMWALGYELRTRLLAPLLVLAQIPQYLALSYGWVFRGSERMEYDALIQVILKLSTLALVLIAIPLGGRLAAVIGIYAVAGSVTFAVALALYRKLHFPALRFSRATARELVWDGAPMLALSLAVAIQPYIDANLLYKLTPAHVVGWYGAAWTIASTLVAPATILGAALYPRLSRVSTDRQAFRHVLRSGFRPLLLVGALGAVGAYLFAGFAVELVYSAEKFGPAAQIIRAFAPALMLIYIDMLFGYAILAVGKAGQLARIKIVSLAIAAPIEFVAITFFQSRFSNGGMGAMFALAAGELIMVGAAVRLLRGFVDRGMVADFGRAVLCGVVTVLVLSVLPPMSPIAAIPLCIALFGVLCGVAGLFTRADATFVLSQLRKRSSSVADPSGP